MRDSGYLVEQLLGVAVESALVVGEAADGRCREEARRDATPDATDTVDADDVQGVVELGEPAQANGPVAEGACDAADNDRLHRLYKAGRRRDGDQSGHSSRRRRR